MKMDNLNEKSVSPSQQRLMGMAYAVRNGKLDRSKVSDEVLKLADGKMSDKDLKDFAKTKHNDMPNKKEKVEESYKMKHLKLFESYLKEGMIMQDLENEYGIILDLFDNGDYMTLSRIEIPKDKRGDGIGSEVMQKIIDYADKNNKDIYLTPSKDFGASSVSRLKKFYKKFGFEKNDDYISRETMVRYPN